MARHPGQGMPPGMARATVCSNCGNHFMEDSNFCRRCGTPRPAVAAGAQAAPLAPAAAAAPQLQRPCASPGPMFAQQLPAVQCGAVMAPAVAPAQVTYASAPVVVSPPAAAFVQQGVALQSPAALAVATPAAPVYAVQEVVRPVIQELVREVPRPHREVHHVFRPNHEVEYVETEVAVPQVDVHEVIEEVPHVIMHEKIVEVPQVREVEIVRQVPLVEYQEVEKRITLPMYEPRERLVEVPQPVMQEVLVEVPEVKVLELVREVPKIRVQTVPKHVEKPIWQVHEKIVQVPQVTVQEQIVEVPVMDVHEMVKEVALPEVQQVEKQVTVPKIELVDRVIEVPVPEVVENPVEVVEVEYREVVKQVPKYEIRYIDKKVVKHQIEYVERLVEVPHDVYEERVIEVPEVQRVEVIRHKPVTSVQQVPKQVPKHIVRVHQRQIDEPTVLHQEQPVEIPEISVHEALVEIPRPHVEVIPREIPKIVEVRPEQVIDEIPLVLQAERPVEVPEVQIVDAITQVVQPVVRTVDKTVPFVETHAVERVVEVRQAPLLEETRKKRKEERRALKAAELAGDGLRTSEVVDGQKKRKTECQELDEAQAGSLEKKDSQHVKAVQHSGSTPAKRIKAERTKASAATLAGFADVRVSGAGSDAFSPWSRFDELLFPNAPASVYVMEQMGFVSPTVIQAYCWPIACTKRDLIGIAKTGSGKTLAYMLPAFPIIMDAHAAVDTSSGFYKPKPLIAVIAPTRELAVQIEQESNRFQSICGVRTVCVYGGASKTEQIAALSKGADIVVATPGRLNDFLSKPDKYTGKTILSLSSVSYVVLDEADRMLDMGFEPQIRQILSYVSSERQTLLFSATWPEEVRQLATEFISNPIHVVVGACDHFQANGDVEQNVVLVESDATGAAERAAKKRELRRILQDNAAEMCIVFCGMKKTAGVLADELWADGFSATGLHGDMPQWQRDQAMKSFIDGQVKVLVATDVAARGLDVQGITVVVNYDPAEQVDDHVHRTGRTGRAGKKGRAYTILGKGEIRQAKLVAEVIRKAGQVVPDELQALERLPTGNWKTRKSAEWRNRARKNA
eukprot:TRINITY_DN14951_c1_g2_i1.p1 TRINITY_DN14951_c1_g2~~TRINITY_DN14951_c1_g2_i1.p1  ORF type:complete len:1092 (+),score=223.26 TRINITY_DN14951_c1_g2_i1:47-3277(+)